MGLPIDKEFRALHQTAHIPFLRAFAVAVGAVLLLLFGSKKTALLRGNTGNSAVSICRGDTFINLGVENAFICQIAYRKRIPGVVPRVLFFQFRKFFCACGPDAVDALPVILTFPDVPIAPGASLYRQIPLPLPLPFPFLFWREIWRLGASFATPVAFPHGVCNRCGKSRIATDVELQRLSLFNT